MGTQRLAGVDVREAAFWYEAKREGLGVPYAAYFIPPADHQPSVILAVLHQRRSSDAWRERL